MNSSTAFSLKPIGFMKSVFHYKNGTPRQASLCDNARGILTIEKSVFNNPEHSLDGLQGFSHAWILFIFHKNNNDHKKAKVKPPRLDGQRVGVFSTRSPYRPNNIGLSLAKIDHIKGASVHFSGIDILDGSPVIDIKPYIPDYDKPSMLQDAHLVNDALRDKSNHHSDVVSSHPQKQTCDISSLESDEDNPSVKEISRDSESLSHRDGREDCLCPSPSKSSSDSVCDSIEEGFYSLSAALDKAGARLRHRLGKGEDFSDKGRGEEGTTVSEVTECQYGSSTGHNDSEEDILDCLVGDVLCRAASDLFFTQKASLGDEGEATTVGTFSRLPQEKTLSTIIGAASDTREVTHAKLPHEHNSAVTAPWLSSPPVTKVRVIFSAESLQQLDHFNSHHADPRFRTEMLSGPEDARKAIRSILHEEPRSVYRRQKCQNSVYFFALDVLHVTCWFDGDAVTVLRVKPVADVPQLQDKRPVVTTSGFVTDEIENT